MKRCVILFGGCGGRLAEALVFAACAGVLAVDDMQLLLVEPDRSDVHMARAETLLQSYGRVQACFDHEKRRSDAFRPEISFSRWPQRMPGGAATLQEWTQEDSEDALLCQALFAQTAAEQPLEQGFRGDMMLASTTFAGLLREAEHNGEDALHMLVEQLRGEEAQVVLAGSLCGATGSAGIPAMASWLQEQLGESVHLSAVLLAAYGAGEDAAAARAALKECADLGLDMPVCLLGLPEGARLTELTDAGRLPEWLAVHALEWFLRHDASDHSAYTYRAADGALDWSVFGRDAGKYRDGYLRLMKTALFFRLELLEELRERIGHPNALLDRMSGWYAACCRGVLKMDDLERVRLLVEVEDVLTLLDGAWAWMEQVAVTQPPQMRHATAVMEARQAAVENYRETIELGGQYDVLSREAEDAGLLYDNVVHRSGEKVQEDEGERLRQQLRAMEKKLTELTEAQPRLNRRMGGSAAMEMLFEELEARQKEAEELRAQYDEANRRIDQAEEIAAPREQFRILAARTKLKRMERHLSMLDARVKRVERDVRQGSKAGTRWLSPEVIGEGEGAECALFSLDELGLMRMLQGAGDKRTLKQRQETAEERFTLLVPGDVVTVKRVLQGLKSARGQAHPLACLLEQVMALVLEEET